MQFPWVILISEPVLLYQMLFTSRNTGLGPLPPSPPSPCHRRVWKTNQLFNKNIFLLPYYFQDEKNQILTTNIWLNLVGFPPNVLSIVDFQVKCKFYAEEDLNISWKILKTLNWRILSSFINLIFRHFSLFTLWCKSRVSAIWLVMLQKAIFQLQQIMMVA